MESVARDIFLYGIDQKQLHERLRLKWSDWQLPPEKQAYWLEIMALPTIRAIQSLEDLFYKAQDWPCEQLHSALGFQEIAALRSRANGLALLEVITYFNNHYSWEDSKTPRFVMSDGSALLTRALLEELLEWVLTVSAGFAEEDDVRAYDWMLSRPYRQQAERMTESPSFYRDSYAEFGQLFPVIWKWRQAIQGPNDFDLYYLENTF